MDKEVSQKGTLRTIRKGVIRYTTISSRKSWDSLIGKGSWNFIIKDYFAFCKFKKDWEGVFREYRLKFFAIGIKRMDVGFNLYFPKSHYMLSIRVPFGKWLNRKKYAKEQALIDRLNKEDNLTHEYALILDDYGHVI